MYVDIKAQQQIIKKFIVKLNNSVILFIKDHEPIPGETATQYQRRLIHSLKNGAVRE